MSTDDAYRQPAAGRYGEPGAGAGKRNGLGIAALVLGILAILTSITVIGGAVLGVGAIVLGLIGRARAKRGEATNGGVALAGVITGVIGLLLAAALIALGASLLNSDSGKDLQSCLKDAGSDQAKVQQCQQQFADSIKG